MQLRGPLYGPGYVELYLSPQLNFGVRNAVVCFFGPSGPKAGALVR